MLRFNNEAGPYTIMHIVINDEEMLFDQKFYLQRREHIVKENK